MNRRAGRGPRGLAIAILLVLWQALAAAPARAAEISQPTVACVDPKATYVLTGSLPGRRDARWQAGVGRRGRCFSIRPGERWERIYGVGGLTLMRRIPPQPGVPPLFFRNARSGAAPALHVPVSGPPSLHPSTARARPHRPRVRPRHPDGVEAPVLVETLPPPEPPASAAAPAPAPTPVPDAVPAAAAPAPRPGLGAADVGAEAPAQPSVTPLPAPPPASAEVAAASARGYAIGFALAIVLIVTSLAALALLARVLLRSPPAPAREPSPHEPPTPEAPSPRPSSHDASCVGLPTRPRAVLRAVRTSSPPLAMLQAAGPRASWPGDDETDPRLQCAVLLREAGWDVSSRLHGRGPDLIARRRGRVVALRCLPASGLVDEQAVEAACVARERVRADLAVIVSNARCTSDARQLASRIGVDLLQEDQLRGYAA